MEKKTAEFFFENVAFQIVLAQQKANTSRLSVLHYLEVCVTATSITSLLYCKVFLMHLVNNCLLYTSTNILLFKYIS